MREGGLAAGSGSVRAGYSCNHHNDHSVGTLTVPPPPPGLVVVVARIGSDSPSSVRVAILWRAHRVERS